MNIRECRFKKKQTFYFNYKVYEQFHVYKFRFCIQYYETPIS